jgi:hypothetical protein
MTSLIVGLKAIRDAAIQITQEDLHSHGTDEFVEKLDNNPLKRTFQVLGDILLQRSREAEEREAARRREAREAGAARKKQPHIIQNKNSTADGVQSIAGPRQPSSLPSTPQKRDFSDTSFGTRSTETTPSKLTKPESSIQNLQNMLVYDVLDAIYDAAFIRVPWARGRKNMRLNYEPFVFPRNPFNSRSCKTSFVCRFPDNQTDRFDSVTAISDGAFILVTDKITASDRSGIWSKHSACLLFEVRILCLYDI